MPDPPIIVSYWQKNQGNGPANDNYHRLTPGLSLEETCPVAILPVAAPVLSDRRDLSILVSRIETCLR